MKINFEKFQGTGNDFILIDNRNSQLSNIQTESIIVLCDRKYGVGSDGLILINHAPNKDFEMVFYNPDGSQSFCGNGARCAIAFAIRQDFKIDSYSFNAIDGEHEFRYNSNLPSLRMKDVNNLLQVQKNAAFLDTGSPHYVVFCDDLSTENVLRTGKNIRYSADYAKLGVNVNLIEKVDPSTIRIATYERGVENETLSCGTGATASVLFYAHTFGITNATINVLTKGGTLTVSFEKSENDLYHNIWLSGPASYVFSGSISL